MKKITYYILSCFFISMAVVPVFSQTGAELQAEAEKAYQDAYLKETFEEQAKAFDEAAELYKKAAEAYRKEGNEEKAKSMDGWAGAASSNADQRRKMFQYGVSVPPPWSDISLIDERMKPGYPFVIPIDKPFPWIPVIGGVVGAGIITAILIGGDDDPVDCTFTASAIATNSTCGQSNGGAMINVSPSDTYTYVWSNGPTTAAIQNVPAGTYTATVTRVGTDCNRVVNATVSNTNPSFTATVGTIAAHCGQNDGSATVSVSPPAAYTYAWSGGGTGATQSNLAPGSYSVTVSAGGNCTETYNLTIGELPPEFDINIHQTPASCGQSDGSAVAVVTKGDYAFVWSTGHTGAALSDVPAGEYSVTVTINGTSCQKTGSVVIEEMPPDFTLTFTTTPSGCGISNGSATVVADPPDEYDYVWSTGVNGSQLIDVDAGEYQVTVTIAGTECAISASVTVEELQANFTLAISTTPAQCGVADGSAAVTVDPLGDYTFQWPTGSTLPTASDLAAGTYVLTVTNSGGCSSTGEFTISGIPADFIDDISTIPGNCLGEGANIVVVTQTHASGPMEISATGPDGLHVVSAPPGFVNLNTFFTVLPGAWHITVVDMSLTALCIEEADVQVDDNTVFNPIDDFYETLADQPVNGNVLDNDSGIGMTVTDFTQPTGGTVTVNADGSFIYTPPSGLAGQFTFTYTVTDACGTSATHTVTITVNSLDCLFDVTFSVTHSDCGLTNASITTIVIPDGNYTFLWSTGQPTQNLIDISAGQYNVTVTSIDLNCNKTFAVTVDELPVSYISNISTTPGNCTGEGEITVTVSTPGDGPLVFLVDGPEGLDQFTLSPGTHDLSSFMNIPSGTYSISVYDQGVGEACTETIEVTVVDNTPELIAADDAYQTQFNTPVSDNVLDNDSGLDLTLTSVSQVSGGIVDFNADGSFTFIPDPGFSGVASFIYTVTDACGSTGTAFVEIEVALGVCEFTVQFVSTNASCGLEDGSVAVEVDLPGTYLYDWSTGDSGPLITNISAGTYSVTIEDINLECSLVFETEVAEDPAVYISDVQILQPMCSFPGDILFELSSPGGGPFDITVTLPDGLEVTFTVPGGSVSILEFVPISPGNYHVSVIDVNAGPSCVDEFDATIMATTPLTIIVETIIPPSTPSAMDGAIVIVTTVPGTLPYDIFLNGDSWGVALDNSFSIGGLGAGDYTVQIQDANGCFSNTLNVTVPFPGSLGLEMGFGLMNIPVPNTVPEPVEGPVLQQSSTSHKTIVRSFVEMGLHYTASGIKQVTSIAIYRDDYNAVYANSPAIYLNSLAIYREGPVYRFSHLVEIGEWRYKGFNFRAHGGLSMDVIRDIPVEQYWTIQGSVSKKIGKMLTANATISMRGWETIEMPVIEVGVKMPVVGVQTSVSAR